MSRSRRRAPRCSSSRWRVSRRSPACRPRRGRPPKREGMKRPSWAWPPGPSGRGSDPRLVVGTLEVPPSTASRPPRMPRGGALRGGGSVGSAGQGGFGRSGSNGKACQARRRCASSGSPDAPGPGRAPGSAPGAPGAVIFHPVRAAPSPLERRQRSSRGSEAQGSIGRLVGGNAGGSQRTRRWIKALRSVVTPRTTARPSFGKAGRWYRARLTARRHRPR